MSLKSYCEEREKQVLLEQWDTERNLPLTPETVGHASGKLVWWQGEKGHSWQTQVHSRSANFTGCPQCNEARMEEKRRRKHAEQENAKFSQAKIVTAKASRRPSSRCFVPEISLQNHTQLPFRQFLRHFTPKTVLAKQDMLDYI